MALLHAVSISLLLIWGALLGGTREIGAGAMRARAWANRDGRGPRLVRHAVPQAPRASAAPKRPGSTPCWRMPALQITDTPASPPTRRACAYIVVVTSGLRESLGDHELEAVLAHALTHIRNRDNQLMVVAVIFAGIFAFFGDLAIRNWDFLPSPVMGAGARAGTAARGAAAVRSWRS